MSAYNNTQYKVNNNHCYLKIKRTMQTAGKGVGFASSIKKNDSLFMEDEPALQTVRLSINKYFQPVRLDPS
jgi:hypothetical protein